MTYALGGDKRKNRHPLIASDDMGGSAKRETLELVRAYYKIRTRRFAVMCEVPCRHWRYRSNGSKSVRIVTEG